ncbi:two-component system response regulator NarL [Thioalkalivibrio nitratireducens]|uniref:two-component system response regulator NarL n=1 Tax=Thioalkalivibrio nitratireducens TaxID=186931 RepID=UPI0005C1D0E3|nr:two-component system response regulator NarL [Thioalkalivibrio nitratireducens]
MPQHSRKPSPKPDEPRADARVVIIDDHPLFRKGARELLEPGTGFEVVGEASSGAEGLRRVGEIRPDLVLLDLNMAEMDGLETLRRLHQADPDMRVVMLTVSDREEDLVEALRAGASGYLLKDMEPEDLLDRLRQVLEGHLVLSEGLTEHLARAVRREHEPTPLDRAGLTERETEILNQIADGLSNKHIARNLDITEGTVKVHVKNLLRKLNLRSRVEAAVWMVEQRRPH